MLPTLLIADDDPVVRSMLAMALEQRFEIVGAATTADEAVTRAAETRPDVVIVDVQMPAGGGPHAVRGIAEHSPDTAIVVLSSDESDTIVRELVQAGAITYVRKGVSSRALVETLENSIRAHRAQLAEL